MPRYETVRATKLGFDGQRRRPGTKFTMDLIDFEVGTYPHWVRPCDPNEPDDLPAADATDEPSTISALSSAKLPSSADLTKKKQPKPAAKPKPATAKDGPTGNTNVLGD